MPTLSQLDIESLPQETYVEQALQAEGLGYCPKAKFITDYQASTMDTFIGTKAQCDALFETTKNAGELRYKDRARKINTRAQELRAEWFDYHTSDLTETEKAFVTRLMDKLDIEVYDAIEYVSDFTDLLKD